MTHTYGLATQSIDMGYAVKRPLSEMVDRAFGLSEEDPRSLVNFLNVCYIVRRPGFEFCDAVLATFVLNTLRE